MRTAILISVYFISFLSFGQSNTTDRLVTEISPVNASLHAGLYLNVQGKLCYSFNEYLSVSVSHNQEILGGLENAVVKLSEYHYRRNSLSDMKLGITLLNSEKPRLDPTEEIHPKNWVHKLLRMDLGLNYYKFANKRPDYYTYDTDEQGNYKIINSINRLSASLGFSFILRENNIKDPNNLKLKRQHTFSAGIYYGLNYNLQAYVKMPDKNPSERAPKIYSFDKTGYYFNYNFRQQITSHLFLGVDLFTSKMPYVNYQTNPKLPFFFRGGEREPKIQLYLGITVGWAIPFNK
nr:hypothetical protein [uncultured Fluviicola sp.]